jgi:hypothetical protein
VAGFGASNPPRLGTMWYPTDLGVKLRSWFDIERASTLSLSGSLISSWTGIVSGHVLSQALSGAKPAYSAGGFGGRPVATGDGTDDYLALSPDPFSAGAGTEEIWLLVDQAAPLSDAIGRFFFAHGFGGSQGRRITRLASTNDLLGAIGDGAVVQTATIAGGFTGRCLVRMVVKATETDLYLNGGSKTTIAVVPNTTATHLRFFSSANSSPSSFGLGGLNTVIRTDLLTDAEALPLTNFLMPRRG